MEKLEYQSANIIVPQIVDQLCQVEDENQPELPGETIILTQEHIQQANATQDMAALILKMMQMMELMSAQLANQNAPHS